MDEGTTTLDSRQIAEAKERLGADLSFGAALDRTTATLTSPARSADSSSPPRLVMSRATGTTRVLATPISSSSSAR